MKKKIYTLCAIFCCFILHAQNTKILGVIDGIMNNATSFNIVTYDYLTNEYDTIWASNELFTIDGNTLSIDTQHDRLYYVTVLGGCGGSYQHILWRIDLNDSIRSQICSFDEFVTGSIGEMLYDPFTNALIIRDDQKIYSFNLDSLKVDTLCNLVDYGIHCSYACETYNPITGEYFYISLPNYAVPLTNAHFNFLDLFNSTIIDSTNIYQTYGQIDLIFGQYLVNVLTNEYYVLNYELEEIERINFSTGELTSITACPNNYYDPYNDQLEILDYYNELIIIPYCSYPQNWNYANWIAVYDLKKDSIRVVSFEKAELTNYHRFFPGYQALLRMKNNILEACFCDNYTWYLNGSVISDQHSQHLFPATNGVYTFSTTRNGDTIISNPIEFKSVGVQTTENKMFEIYPNPVTTNITIKANTDNIDDVAIIMYNSIGKIVRRSKLTSSHFNIEVGDLSNGIYLIAINYGNQHRILKKIIISK